MQNYINYLAKMKKNKDNVIKLRVLTDSPYFIDKLKNIWTCCVAGYTGTENRIIIYHVDKSNKK